MTIPPTLRVDGRAPDALRPVSIEPRFLSSTPASCLIRMGATWVLCTAAVEEQVPSFLVGRGRGWVTSEYAMIPPSSPQRVPWNRGVSGGRQQEISRLIGRGLRAAIDLDKLGERQVTLDCTVIQADGGTRTAGLTGGYVALALAVHDLLAAGKLQASPLISPVAAISVGIVNGQELLDLAYVEDAGADADVNVIMTADGRLVEVQGTAEGDPFTRQQLDRLLDLASRGNARLFELQTAALARVIPPDQLPLSLWERAGVREPGPA
ncbi:MAG TPA: ribonuclease PH [Chloroflexota bacterium]|nr:ribonuclease PH [Chloroflexota bacterium]